MVLAKPLKMEDMDDETEPKRVAVARISSRLDEEGELLWQYLEVSRNRIFESGIADVEDAYQTFIKSLEIEKMLKTEKWELKKEQDAKEMRRIMKCAIIAYFDHLQTSDMTKIDPAQIENILRRNTSVLYEVMDAYFKTGLYLGLIVNNPKNVYLECVDLYCDFIRKAVSSDETKLNEKDEATYLEALECIRGEK